MIVRGQILKIRKVFNIEDQKIEPGKRGIFEGKPVVGTSRGRLVLDEVQPAGKRWMSGQDYLRGNQKDWFSDQHE